MKLEGGCYCKATRYVADGEPAFKGQCHCRECQYITGGGPNFVMAMPASGFKITKGATKGFKRKDLPNGVTREFCPECGTHLITRSPNLAGMVIIKAGTLDDPKLFGAPQMAIFMVDKQPFHMVPSGIPTFERVPG
jgi:hypothetical protein